MTLTKKNHLTKIHHMMVNGFDKKIAFKNANHQNSILNLYREARINDFSLKLPIRSLKINQERFLAATESGS